MSAPLLGSVVLSDANLKKAQAKVEAAASKVSFSWITAEMVTHVILSTGLAAGVYVVHSIIAYPLSTGAFMKNHLLLGVVLGLLLVGRIILGTSRVQTVASHVQQFTKSCRQMAVLSTFVAETLTVSAGAEMEKKAIGKFRFELVRLLNMAFYCFTLMLEGQKLAVPPSSLQRPDGSMQEMNILSAVDNPTVMICKMIASLLEQQRAAKRISNEQMSVLMVKISDLIEAYHMSLSNVLAPTTSAFASFTYTMTVIFVYTVGPIIAINELEANMQFGGVGLSLTIFYTLLLSLFYFGLYEAGKPVDAPLASLTATLAIEEMFYVLSDDLSSLVDDDSVPVFLPRPE
jgi:hypothetical protein